MNFLLNLFDKYLLITTVLSSSITVLSIFPLKKINDQNKDEKKFIKFIVLIIWLAFLYFSCCLGYLVLTRENYVIVPNVIGETYREASTIIRENELELDDFYPLLDEEKVVKQSIEPGGYCKKNTKIKLKTNISFDWFNIGVDSSYIKKMENTEPIESIILEEGDELLTFGDSYFSGYNGESLYFVSEWYGLFMMGWSPNMDDVDYIETKNKLIYNLSKEYGQFIVDKSSEKDEEYPRISYIWGTSDGHIISLLYNDECEAIDVTWLNKYINISRYDINDFLRY